MNADPSPSSSAYLMKNKNLGKPTSGSLERKPNGTWLLRWQYRGQRFSKSSGTTDRREAETMMKALLADLTRSEDERRVQRIVERFDRSDATEIANLATAYFSSRRCRKYTPAREQEVRGYLRSASEWLAARGCATTTDVTEELAHEYAEYLLSTGLSVNTACRYTATLSAVWMVLTGADRVWKGQLHRSTEAAVGHRALSSEELERVLAKADEAGPEWGLLFRIGMNTGLRLCDASTLTWEETDLEGRVLNVEPNKTRRYGTRVRIPLTDDLASEFLKLEGPRTGFIMPGVATLYLKDRRRVCDKVQPILQSAGIETTV